MGEGWIKLYRSLQNDDLYFAEKFTKMQAWCDLLLLAEYKPKSIYVRGIKVAIERGQLAVPIRELASRWKWGVNRVQSFLRELEENERVLLLKGNTINVIAICNYDKYQGDTQNSADIDTQTDTQTDTQNIGVTNTQKTSINKGVLGKIARRLDTQKNPDSDTQNSADIDTQTDTQTDTQGKEKVTKKKYIQEEKEPIGGGAGANAPAPPPKKPKSKEEILEATEVRRQNFYNSLIPYVKTYGKAMVRAFYDYWSELNKSGTKMKWEICQTWELDRRLSTWERKDSQFSSRNNGTSTNSISGQRPGDATVARQMSAVVNDIAKADEYYYQQRAEQGDSSTQ